ncbi:DUF6659 family protein [Nitrosopumilus adriaticus]|uniref:DUF6659 family protein n=1 Tax=Nitrosopumilus adriaticus TaxID=1580092 RepID=UPI001F36C675|nr:DUF6659 family protein [Nitrosopumilus adriaticus]
MAANYNDLTKQVLNLQPQVKFAAVVNVKGEIVAGGHKENVEQLLVGDNSKMSIHYALQKRDIYTNLTYRIGKERSAITEFEKVAIISIPINSNELFLVRTDKGVDYFKIVEFVYSKLDPQKYIREEMNVIKNEIEKLKNLKEIKTAAKKKVVKRKPARKTAAKKEVVKRKPARKTAAKKKIVKRKPARKTAAKKKVVKRKPARKTAAKKKVVKRKPARKSAAKKKVVKRKPARKTAAKKKVVKRKPARKTAAKKKVVKRKPARKTAAKKKVVKRKPARKTAKPKRKTNKRK